MTERVVTLPNPRPEDDEDVVWGLSTASALWARGERTDAIVWLRRAADAATAAGQDFRASELGMYASEIEDSLAPARASLGIAIDFETDDTVAESALRAPGVPATPAAAPNPAEGIAPRPLTSPPPSGKSGLVAMAMGQQAPASTRSPLPALGGESDPRVGAQPQPMPSKPPAPPPLRSTTSTAARSVPPVAPPPAVVFSKPALAPAVPPPPPSQPHAAVAPPAQPLPFAQTLVSAPGVGQTLTSALAQTMASGPMDDAVREARARLQASAAAGLPPPVPLTSGLVEQGGLSALPATNAMALDPAALTRSKPAPMTPSGGGLHDGVATAVPKLQISPPPPPPPTHVPAAAVAGASPASAHHKAPAAQGSSHGMRKKPPRAPILDPWSEESAGQSQAQAQAAGSRSAVSTAPQSAMARERAEEILLSVRARPPVAARDDDEEVVTSAAPIEDTLKRAQARSVQARKPDGTALNKAAVPSKAPPSGAAPSAAPKAAIAAEPESKPPPTAAPDAVHFTPDARRAPHSATPTELVSLTQSPATTSVTDAPMGHDAGPVAPIRPAHDSQAPTRTPESLAEAKTERAPLPAEGQPEIAAPAPAAKPAMPPRIPAPPPSAPTLVSLGVLQDRAQLEGLWLDEVDAFADLSPDAQRRIAKLGRIEVLGADEEVSGFGAALLLTGDAAVCATLVDAPASRVKRGSVVPTRGTLAEPVQVRVVAGASGARVAVWDPGTIEQALQSCPWVLEELVARADRLQALAGACIGPLGDIDEPHRNLLLDKLTLRVASPHERIAHRGGALSGVVLVGAGSVDLVGADADSVARPGEFLFARAVLEGHHAPLDAHAGSAGALLLVADRKLAQELFVTAPPLVPILSGEG